MQSIQEEETLCRGRERLQGRLIDKGTAGGWDERAVSWRKHVVVRMMISVPVRAADLKLVFSETVPPWAACGPCHTNSLPVSS